MTPMDEEERMGMDGERKSLVVAEAENSIIMKGPRGIVVHDDEENKANLFSSPFPEVEEGTDLPSGS